MEFYENCTLVESFASKKDIVLVLENIISEVSYIFALNFIYLVFNDKTV